MNFREDPRRERMTGRDLAVVVALTVCSWLAVIGAVRVGSIIAGWLL